MFGDKLTDYIQVYDNVFTEEECKDAITLFEHNNANGKTTEYDTPGYKFTQLDINNIDRYYANQIVKILTPVYNEYFERLGVRQYVDLSCFENVRIKRYLKGNGEFRTHVDVGDHSSAKRFAIAIIYLNNNDGITSFPNLGSGVYPETGRVVIFPPMWMFPHSGTVPTNTDKYIMMTCLHYK